MNNYNLFIYIYIYIYIKRLQSLIFFYIKKLQSLVKWIYSYDLTNFELNCCILPVLLPKFGEHCPFLKEVQLYFMHYLHMVIILFSTGLYKSAFSRSSHRKCSVRKGVLRNFANITGKHLGPGLQLYLKKDSCTGAFL